MSDLVRLAEAAHLAARAHADQSRKGTRGVPYVNHVLEVADLVAEAGCMPEEVIAAVLHDVVEDSETTVEELRERFGAEVAELVAGMTDDPQWESLPRRRRKALQAAHMPKAPEGVRRIKIADQCSNLRDIAREPGAWSAARAAEYIEGAEEVVAACRGVSAALEAAFDAALAEAMQKTGEMR